MKKKLYLSTERFPYRNGEKTFLQSELKALAEEYDITIISHAEGELTVQEIWETDLPLGVTVVNCSIRLNAMKIILYFLRYVFDVDGWKEIIDIYKQHNNFFFMLYQSLGFYIRAMENWRLLSKKKLFDRKQDFIFYSFWYTYYTYSMTKHKRKYKNVKIITRAHGFDLYDERYQCGRQPFKKIMDTKLDKIFFACEYAKDYYIKKMYSLDTERYVVSKIGTQPALTNTDMRSEGNVIVSCSRVVRLKRIYLIIDALSLWDKNEIVWHHFGGGEEYDAMEQYASRKLSKNIKVRYYFHGDIGNEDILRFYANNNIICFVTTSSTEGGAPVSIQEAMAYGIPIIGTDVGGITEMIHENGILIKSVPTAEEIRNAIEYIYCNPGARKKMCKASLELWEREYCSEKNVHRFVDLVNQMYG